MVQCNRPCDCKHGSELIGALLVTATGYSQQRHNKYQNLHHQLYGLSFWNFESYFRTISHQNLKLEAAPIPLIAIILELLQFPHNSRKFFH